MDMDLFFHFKRLRVLVAGDLMLDDYIGGTVGRISPEAPVPVLDVSWESRRLGGAGNVVNNLAALSAGTRVLSCIGDDTNGTELTELLREKGADVRFLYRSPEIATTTKTRVVAKNQQVVRLDREIKTPYPPAFADFVDRHIGEALDGVHIVVLSDYGKGVLTPEVCGAIISAARRRDIPVFVDPKGTNWQKYTGAAMCTPNLSELSQICGVKLDQTMESEIYRCGLELCDTYDFDHLLVTRSEKGMSLIRRNGEKTDFPVVKKEVVDVSGAGDTVISTMVLGTAAGLPVDDCCRLANLAASIVVSKLGTATASLPELIGSQLFASGRKVIRREEVPYLADYLHEAGKTIVFTNGCFDLVHAGHVYSLEQARACGDVLVVGLNSDASVKRLKGALRPIVGEDDRACMLQALRPVDYVVIFDEDTPEQLIRAIAPDVLVKGKDYAGKEVAGGDFVLSRGGRVELIDLKPGLSTTHVIEKICTAYSGGNQT